MSRRLAAASLPGCSDRPDDTPALRPCQDRRGRWAPNRRKKILRAVASKSPVVLSAAASSSMTSRRVVVRQVFVQNHRPLGSQKAHRDAADHRVGAARDAEKETVLHWAAFQRARFLA